MKINLLFNKSNIPFALIFLGFIIASSVNAQCPVVAYANPITVTCGDTVKLSAVADGIKPLNNNFNSGSVGPDWQATNGAVVTNGTGTYACAGPPPEGANYLWMGGTVGGLRNVVTNDYNLISAGSTSGTICFDMKYATQAGPGVCEGIDLPAEGVSVQYSTNGGGSWTTIQYWNPNGGYDPTLTVWNRYCLNIPAAAFTATTRFRWVQTQNSGAGFDTWGLDDMVITLNIPGFTFDWTHDGLPPSASSFTPPVVPMTNTTYTVNYTNGTQNCSSNISVTVLSPTTTPSISPATVCPGGATQLDVTSALKANPPTSCGVNANASCPAFSTVSDEKQVGNGTLVYGYNDGSYPTWGNFGSAYATTHILYRAADLLAAGMVAGQINSLAFDVTVMRNSGGSQVYPEVKIDMGCTSATTMVNYTNPNVTFSTVYNPKPYTMNVGIKYFFFDKSYNWDGVQNIVVRICWRVATGGSASAMSIYAFTKDNSPGYNCVFSGNSNFEAGQCAISSFTSLQSRRPNTIFGFCRPNNAALTYNWTSTPAGFSSGIRNPTANPASNTTYTVVVNQVGRPAGCAVTSAPVSVSVVAPTVSISPSTATVCPPGTPNVPLTATASTSGNGTFTPVFTNTGDYPIPDNNATGISSTILVSGVTPGTMPAALPISVCLNITHGNDADLDISLRAPNGTIINLSDDNGGTGNNYTSTCFSTAGPAITGGVAPMTGTFTPEQAFSTLSGNINGTWTLIVKDDAASNTGTLLDWSISFNSTTNGVTTYAWSPTTGLSNPSISNPTASPAVTTTYTLTITDAAGCTSTSSAIIGYCVAVPLELINFSGVKKGDQVNLSWITAMEKGTSHFIIERSFNGTSFESIGRVEAIGNSNITQNYTFTDASPVKEINYYRLRSYDVDGKDNYSQIISVSISDNPPFNIQNISPVPAKERINCSIYSQTDIAVKVFIYDVSGRKLMEKPLMLNMGTNWIEEDVSGLASGIYLLRVQMEDGKKVIQRFIK